MTSAHSAPPQQLEGINKRRLVGFLLGLPLYFGLFLFLPAGSLAWMRGWLFIGVFLATMAGVAWYLWRVNPEVVVARASAHQGTKRWDKILLCFFFPSVYAIVPVAALDDGRFHWLPMPWWVCGVGYGLFLAGMGILTWAEAVNKFFEPTVRIQTDRGHKVIDRGPYAIVRHPGYVGGILFCVGSALCLGSLWALVPAGLACVVLILRTYWEDQTLQAELAGYKAYTQRVRSRLIPGVW
jgi:protein-S-isoprenylcysteine O-methyltransferase Ste14